MNRSCDQGGAALITVLALLALVAAIVAGAVALSLYSSVESTAAVDRARSFYAAESALNRGIFQLRRDIAGHPARTLGGVYDEDNRLERWMADGVVHVTRVGSEDYRVTVADAGGSPSLEVEDPQEMLRDLYTARRERLAALGTEQENLDFDADLDRFGDYIDGDSFRNLNGMEADEYRKLGLAALPRNGAIQFREEVLWIPGVREFFGSGPGRFNGLAVVAPASLAAPEYRLSFYSSPVDFIADQYLLTQNEIGEVRLARRAWRGERERPESNLNVALCARLEAILEVDETGTYTLRAEPESGSGAAIEATLRFDGGAHFLEFYDYFTD